MPDDQSPPPHEDQVRAFMDQFGIGQERDGLTDWQRRILEGMPKPGDTFRIKVGGRSGGKSRVVEEIERLMGQSGRPRWDQPGASPMDDMRDAMQYAYGTWDAAPRHEYTQPRHDPRIEWVMMGFRKPDGEVVIMASRQHVGAAENVRTANSVREQMYKSPSEYYQLSFDVYDRVEVQGADFNDAMDQLIDAGWDPDDLPTPERGIWEEDPRREAFNRRMEERMMRHREDQADATRERLRKKNTRIDGF